ncbi:hypothetical protein EAE96_005763 [Botrytis aclada]|nr:hypothetical protein EAE96_005763 [Botrytis aclada]
MESHRKFTDKVKAHPKYFQIFLVVLVVTFTTIILIAGVLKTPLLELHAPDDEYDLYLIYFFEGCRSIVNGNNDGCHSFANGGLPAVLSDGTPVSGLPNLKIIFALFFLTGLAHLVHGLFGIKVHLNHLHHPKIENVMAFISFFTLLAAAIACPWILLDYRCQIQFISNDDITVKAGTSIIGLGFTAVLFSLVSREILIVGTLNNERALLTFSETPRNGEDSRPYSRDDEDLRRPSFYNEEAERLQIPVQGVIREESPIHEREYPRSMSRPMTPGVRMAPPPPTVYESREPPPPPSRSYFQEPQRPLPPTFAGYG